MLPPRLPPSETQNLEKKGERGRGAMDSRAFYSGEIIRGLRNTRRALTNRLTQATTFLSRGF